MHNPIIVCKVLEHFGNWLYDEKYTDYKVQANYKDDSWSNSHTYLIIIRYDRFLLFTLWLQNLDYFY